MTSMTLFYAPGACSLAPHILLEETGHPFEARSVDTKGGEQNRPDYLRINPKGRVPALAVDDWVLTENPAILQYIARRFPEANLWPDDLREQAQAAEWLAWIASTVHVAYAHVRRTARYATSESAQADVRAKGLETARRLWLDIEGKLGTGDWAVGDRYSAVDAYLMVFWMWGRGNVLAFDMAKDCPAWTAQARRVAARPAVQRAFARETLDLPA